MAKVTEIDSSAFPVKKIKVYKRPLEPDNGNIFDSSGFLKIRLWVCTGVPEDSRTTCHASWKDAMRWATMCHEERVAAINKEAEFEMGQ